MKFSARAMWVFSSGFGSVAVCRLGEVGGVGVVVVVGGAVVSGLLYSSASPCPMAGSVTVTPLSQFFSSGCIDMVGKLSVASVCLSSSSSIAIFGFVQVLDNN